MARLSDLSTPVQRDYTLQICSELDAAPENINAIVDSMMVRFI
jgi:hypothetical protein